MVGPSRKYKIVHPNQMVEGDEVQVENGEIDVQKKRVYKKIKSVKHCIVMRQLGSTLSQLNEYCDFDLSYKSIIQIAIQLVTCLE